MAKATVTSVPPVPVESIQTVTLELTMREAEVLRFVVGNIGGANLAPGRTETGEVWDALVNAGVLSARDVRFTQYTSFKRVDQ